MKLSRTVSYAIQATLQLAEGKSTTPVPCSRLAAEGEMPERFLLQILRSLVTHGILRSTRGVEGGYTLDRDPNDISLLEIIEAVDGPLRSSLPSAKKLSQKAREALERALSDVAEESRQRLAAIRLGQLIEDSNDGPESSSEDLRSASQTSDASESSDMVE